MSRHVFVIALAGALVLGATGSSASAATAGWMVNGTTLSSDVALASTASLTEDMELETTDVTVDCPKGTTHTGTSELHINLYIVLWKRKWLNCVRTKPLVCTLSSPTIETVPLRGLEATLEGALADRLTIIPTTKSTIATIKFEGENCAITGVQPLTGKITVRMPAGQDERTLQEAAVNITAASGELKLGSSAAALKETYQMKLLSGEPWSYL